MTNFSINPDATEETASTTALSCAVANLKGALVAAEKALRLARAVEVAPLTGATKTTGDRIAARLLAEATASATAALEGLAKAQAPAAAPRFIDLIDPEVEPDFEAELAAVECAG